MRVRVKIHSTFTLPIAEAMAPAIHSLIGLVESTWLLSVLKVEVVPRTRGLTTLDCSSVKCRSDLSEIR